MARLEIDLDVLPVPIIEEARMLHSAFLVMHIAFASFRRFVPSAVILDIIRTNVSRISFEIYVCTKLFF